MKRTLVFLVSLLIIMFVFAINIYANEEPQEQTMSQSFVLGDNLYCEVITKESSELVYMGKLEVYSISLYNGSYVIFWDRDIRENDKQVKFIYDNIKMEFVKEIDIDI